MKPVLLIAIIVCFVSACTENKTSNENAVSTSDSLVKQDNDDIATNRPAQDTNNESAENKLIIAGKSIGKIELDKNDSVIAIELGKPDMSDAAMGKAWLTWYGKKPDEHNNKTQLNIYTAYKDTSMREKTIQQIRTTSSFFETKNGLHVYSSFRDIKKQFPGIKKVATYTDEGRAIIVYDAQQQGIAFEIVSANDQEICTGIIIHQKGVKVTKTYISLH